MSPSWKTAAEESSDSNIRVTRYVLIQLGSATGAATTAITGIARIELLPWRTGMNLPEFLTDLIAARQAVRADSTPGAKTAAAALALLHAALDPDCRPAFRAAGAAMQLCWPPQARRRQILERLLHVPFGRTISYGGLAAAVSPPSGARAVGQAMNKNPFPIVVPCHRVIQSDGSLGGFGAGLDWKRALLDWEATHRTAFTLVSDATP